MGKPARIVAKMNSLCDAGIINALYEASAAGVQIELIIRGICCLKQGVPGMSETIQVRSIVGTFLEHSRIFYFENDGSPEIYMGSADWMPRNLDKRVEILFPCRRSGSEKGNRSHPAHPSLPTIQKAHLLQPDGLIDSEKDGLVKVYGGCYKKADRRGHAAICSQMQFCKEAKRMQNK